MPAQILLKELDHFSQFYSTTSHFIAVETKKGSAPVPGKCAHLFFPPKSISAALCCGLSLSGQKLPPFLQYISKRALWQFNHLKN
jgi:hypothetical protein